MGVVNEEPQTITAFHSDIDYFNENKCRTQGDKIKENWFVFAENNQWLLIGFSYIRAKNKFNSEETDRIPCPLPQSYIHIPYELHSLSSRFRG